MSAAGDAIVQDAADPALASLLAPLAGDDPCGPAMRYDPVFTEIRLAREEDDPNLPMRQWERPLQRADWPRIVQLCTTTLETRTKDLQLAAWLLEAWTRQQGLPGLRLGLDLVHGLLERFWEPLHPRIEDGDVDARIAPLQWLNDAMAATLKVHLTLVPLTERKPSRVTLADWEKMTASELAGTPGEATGEDGQPPLTRDEVTANARRHAAAFLKAQLVEATACRERVAALAGWLDERLGLDAPNFSRLRGTLETMERVLAQLQPTLASRVAAAVGLGAAAAAAVPPEQEQGTTMDAADAGAGPAPLEPTQGAGPVRHGGWTSRDDAYRTLEALADYLGHIEPHSPTPYLIRRAVNWGRMPLPELFAEIMREEGDLNRMINVLGLQRRDEP